MTKKKMEQYNNQIISSLKAMGYPRDISSAMLERAVLNRNSPYWGLYDGSDVVASARQASRQIIESWRKLDNQQYKKGGYTDGIRYGQNWLVPYY